MRLTNRVQTKLQTKNQCREFMNQRTNKRGKNASHTWHNFNQIRLKNTENIRRQGLHMRGSSSRIEPTLQNQLLQVSFASEQISLALKFSAK